MSKKLFSMVSISSVLFLGTAFSSEGSHNPFASPLPSHRSSGYSAAVVEEGTGGGKVRIRGVKFEYTPETAKAVTGYQADYLPTEVKKTKAKKELGDVDGMPGELAELMFNEALEEEVTRENKRVKELLVFLEHRKDVRKSQKKTQEDEAKLQKKLVVLESYNESLKSAQHKKDEEIEKLNASMHELTSLVSALETDLSIATSSSLQLRGELEFAKNETQGIFCTLGRAQGEANEAKERLAEIQFLKETTEQELLNAQEQAAETARKLAEVEEQALLNQANVEKKSKELADKEQVVGYLKTQLVKTKASAKDDHAKLIEATTLVSQLNLAKIELESEANRVNRMLALLATPVRNILAGDFSAAGTVLSFDSDLVPEQAQAIKDAKEEDARLEAEQETARQAKAIKDAEEEAAAKLRGNSRKPKGNGNGIVNL